MDKAQSQVKPNLKTVLQGYRELLTQGWQWWIAELISLLPPGLRSRIEGRGRYLLAELHEEKCSIRYGQRGDFVALGDYELEALKSTQWRHRFADEAAKVDDTILFLPPGLLLVREISLPLATASNLNNVLLFEMDRYTPFKADQVYYGFRIVQRDLKAQTVLVRIALITRQRLDPILNTLSSLGMPPTVVAPAAEASSTLYSMNLLPKSLQGSRSNRHQLVARGRLLLVLITIGLLFWLPLYYQDHTIASLNTAMEEPRLQAETAREVNEQINVLTQSQGFLERKKSSSVSNLMLLNELTEVLPDHTWISNLQVDATGVRLQGESREASALISVLESTRYLRNVRFASPVTLNARTTKERFAIVADLSKEQP